MGSRFWRMYSAYFVTTVGDELYILALPLVLLQLDYTAASATFLRGALTATTVVAGFTIGYLVDRRDTYFLLSRAYGFSAVCLLAAAALLSTGVDALLVSLLAAAVLGFFAAVAAAAVDAGIPRTVSEQHLIRRGYSLVESARTIALIAGPALAGFIAATRSVLLVTLVNAVSFLLAAGLSRRRPEIPDAGRSSDPEAGSTSWQRILSGLRVVARQTPLRLGIALSLLANLTLGASQPLFLTRMVRDFGLSALVTALVVTLAGAMSIATSMLIVHFAHRVRAATAMVLAILIFAAAGIGVGVASGPVPASALYCLLCVATFCYAVYWRSYRQEMTPAHLLGWVSATCRSIAYSGVVLGVVIVGSLQQFGVSEQALLVTGGAICMIGALIVAPAVHRASAATAAALSSDRTGS